MASESDSSSSQQFRPLPLSAAPPAERRPLVGVPVDFLGRIIGRRFEIVRKLGSGGVGTVYSAIDLVTRKPVAIKVVNSLRYTADNLKRFRREAAAVYWIRHPHLCRGQYLGVEHGTPYIVMEHLLGETVARRLDRMGALPVADAVVITLQLLDALSAVHAHGYLHRDVKPANVLLLDNPEDFVKLIDFGLVRAVRRQGAEREETITTTGFIAGTPAYLSPEQILGVRDLDERVDVWGAGVMIYEMLTGVRLYAANDFIGLANAIIHAPAPRPISEIRPEVPKELDDVIARSVAKLRDQRFRSADDFRRALIEAWSRHRSVAVVSGLLLRKGVQVP